MRLVAHLCSLLCLLAPLRPEAARAAPPAAPKPGTSFATEVAPILQRRCVVCHGPDKAKGHFRLDTFEALMKPGASEKPTIVAGQAGKSHLLQLLVEKNEDDRMPQKAGPLPAAEIDVIRAWIAGGAKFDGPSPAAPLVSFLPKPSHPPAPKRYAHPWPVTALAFNRDGSQVIVGGYREATFWNLGNHQMTRRIGGMPERIHAIVLQPGGGLVAVAGGSPGHSGEVLLFEIASLEPPRELAIAGDEMLCAAYSPDGRHLAAGGADKIVRLFDVKSGAEILKLEQHSDWVHDVAFSPDGCWLGSASRDRTARVYNSTNGETRAIFRDHEAAVESLLFANDGKMVLSAGADHTVRSWDSADASHAKEFAKFGVAVTAMVPGEHSVFIALADGRVVQRRPGKREEARRFSGDGDRVTALAIHEGLELLAIGSHGGRVRVWNLKDGSLVSDFTASPGITR